MRVRCPKQSQTNQIQGSNQERSNQTNLFFRYGYRSIAGEIQQFENKQANLRTLLLEHQTKGCKQNTQDAWKYATREVPKKVPNVDPEKVQQVAIVLGLGVAVVIAVFAAPEVMAAGVLAGIIAKIA